ncbi:response regulator transcription factor [Pseudonocardia acaciae]|uniref:response regulator transcription factor n=1 Tax=Pseudonocardia acaciae TaxID=551276 RepID=UPI000B2E5E27|nr:response regulator transcription factor [Pseudonocardia acaciae]
MSVRIVIVDDDQLVRMALRLIMEGEPGLEVVGEGVDGDSAIAVVRERLPDVVLMDVRMPGRDGLSATEEILRLPRPPGVLVLTTFDSDEMVLGALRAGALGFVLKDSPPPDLVAAVRSVAAGNPALSPAATSRVIAAATGPGSSAAREASRESARGRLAVLTERELDTARAIAEGLSNAEIAQRLHVSVATVKAHTSSLFTKLTVGNRVQIALLVRDAEG